MDRRTRKKVDSTSLTRAKSIRLFMLLNALTSRKMNIAQMASLTGADPRSVLRYIDLIKELGFQVCKHGMSMYYIGTEYYPEFVKNLIDKEVQHG